MIRKLDFSGNPYIGVYAFSTEKLLVVPSNIRKKTRKELEKVLGPRAEVTTIGDSVVVGSLMTGNSSGVVFTNFIKDDELNVFHDLKTHAIDSRLNAVGNTILANDYGCLVHPGYDNKTIKGIEKCLGVKARKGSIASIKTVGSVAVATNKGVLCHPNTTEKELEFVQESLGVPATIGSANYGVGHVGACVLANSKGAIVGSRTTPIEMGRVEDALRLY
jgi:translation initiation factor 6